MMLKRRKFMMRTRCSSLSGVIGYMFLFFFSLSCFQPPCLICFDHLESTLLNVQKFVVPKSRMWRFFFRRLTLQLLISIRLITSSNPHGINPRRGQKAVPPSAEVACSGSQRQRTAHWLIETTETRWEVVAFRRTVAHAKTCLHCCVQNTASLACPDQSSAQRSE